MEFAAYCFLALSILFFAAAVVAAVKVKRGKLWAFALLMLFSALCLMITVTVVDRGQDESVWERVINVISSSFQLFTLDADYAGMMGKLTALDGPAVVLCGIMVILMTFVAPATGGFAIFGFIANFIPSLKLWLLSHKHTRYVFSELNEYSVAAAESIYEKRERLKKDAAARIKDADWESLKSSVIVFTDAYADGNNESASELMERAGNIGAICIKNDVTQKKFRWHCRKASRKILYFLLDKREENNLDASLALFFNEKKLRRWSRAAEMELYVFTRTDDANGVIARKVKNCENLGCSVLFKTINEFKNLVYQLIDGEEECAGRDCKSYPLYYRFQDDPESADKLSVLIIGGGGIGREFLKAAYWCGQMLGGGDKPSCKKLYITVVDKDAESIELKLKQEMPAVDFDNETEKGAYCTFGFIPKDAEQFDTEKVLKEEIFPDYVLVALGNDELNMRVAHRISRAVNCKVLGSGKDVINKIPVNYVIENSGLCASLAEYYADEKCEFAGGACVLNPFGSLKHRYGLNNICQNKLCLRAWSVSQAHVDSVDLRGFLSDNYQYNSSLASALHYNYKQISLGVKRGEDVDYGDKKTCERLYWLEHRRWVAYMRTIGSRAPNLNEFCDGKGNFYYKRMGKRLHACMLECGTHLTSNEEITGYDRTKVQKLIKATSKADGATPLQQWLDGYPVENFDALDKIGLICNTNFKEYDIAVIKNLYRDKLRATLVESLQLGSVSGADGVSERILKAYDGCAGQAAEAGGVKAVFVAKWGGYHLVAAKFKDGVKEKSSKRLKVYGGENFELKAFKPKKNKNFAVVYKSGVALLVFKERQFEFGGITVKIIYDKDDKKPEKIEIGEGICGK